MSELNINTFVEWLKANKGRPIGNLTDGEISRYADDYAREQREAGRKEVEADRALPDASIKPIIRLLVDNYLDESVIETGEFEAYITLAIQNYGDSRQEAGKLEGVTSRDTEVKNLRGNIDQLWDVDLPVLRAADYERGKLEGMRLALTAIQSGKITMSSPNDRNEYLWWVSDNQDINGTTIDSLIKYLREGDTA